MKIAVYQIEVVKPVDANEEQEFCEIFGLPSLKHGTVQFLGNFSHWITKSELNKERNKIARRYYDRKAQVWRDGVLLADSNLFAQYAQ